RSAVAEYRDPRGERGRRAVRAGFVAGRPAMAAVDAMAFSHARSVEPREVGPCVPLAHRTGANCARLLAADGVLGVPATTYRTGHLGSRSKGSLSFATSESGSGRS